ncbi:MAG: exodeoxyribonuclease III [Oscillospiraceae bacterium]|jgi:exodeoxyribonuclease-3|nr:exodeoxyribonuclease III [Oscillospiraceae bacterium]
MKLVSWNVNGVRACLKNGFAQAFAALDADVFCLQETKAEARQVDTELFLTEGYEAYWNSAQKRGYAGTAVFSRAKPLNATFGLGLEEHDKEGRVVNLEFPEFWLVNVYTPNSRRELERLSYRMEWEDAFRAHVCKLDQQKPVLVCGDMNVAHQPIDIARPAANHHSAGFTDEERGKMTELLAAGFTDTFRYFYPERGEAYSWWSYMGGARERNVGWRIDYWLCSRRFAPRLSGAGILPDVHGSDHCPVWVAVRG